MVLFRASALRKAYASKHEEEEKTQEVPNSLEDLVCNESTTQNWLRDKLFNRTNKSSRLVGIGTLAIYLLMRTHNMVIII